MCSLRFENNLLTSEGVRFASISKKTPLSKLSFAFVSLTLPLLVYVYGQYGGWGRGGVCVTGEQGGERYVMNSQRTAWWEGGGTFLGPKGTPCAPCHFRAPKSLDFRDRGPYKLQVH